MSPFHTLLTQYDIITSAFLREVGDDDDDDDDDGGGGGGDDDDDDDD